MQLITTPSFELATITKGDKNSQRVALVLPGRLDTKDYAHIVSHLEYLAGKGFYAAAFDLPGTWDSPGGLELFTTTNYIKAVNELIDYFGNKPTLLLGHSRGASTAILVGTVNSAVVGIVAVFPSLGAPSPPHPDDIQGNTYLDSRDLPPGTKKTLKRKRFEVPLSYFEDGGKYDDAEVLASCTKPKLIFYATQDEFNTPEDVRLAFKHSPEPKTLYKLNCTHDYRYYPDVIKKVNEVVGQFLDNLDYVVY